MKKIILSLFILSLFVAPAVFAERDSDRENKVRASAVDISCVSTAVGVREDALLSAWNKFDDAVTAVLTARKSALISAWALTDRSARRSAVKEAWSTARKDRKSATATYKSERKTAWSTFKTSAKACGGDVGDEASSDGDKKETVEI